ncbi:MAG: NUDIX domain-containing protein [Bacteroidia bacterium]
MSKNISHEENPWITKTTEQVYESAWIKVTKSDVINPAGNDAIYSVVHFKNLAIGVLPLDKEYNTWLVGQYRYPTDSYSWEIPEGGGKMDVDPIESASRELKEETGVVAQKYTEFMRLHTSNSVTNELAIVYIATELSFENAEPEESELLQVKKLHLNEAFDWVMQGKITDGISVAAILKAKWLLDNAKLFV